MVNKDDPRANDSFVNWLNSMPKEGLKSVTKIQSKSGKRWKITIQFNTGHGFILSNFIPKEVKFQFDKETVDMYKKNLDLVCITDLVQYTKLIAAKEGIDKVMGAFKQNDAGA